MEVRAFPLACLPEAAVLGLNAHSVPSSVPPDCSHGRSPAPTCPSAREQGPHGPPCCLISPACCHPQRVLQPDICRPWPSGPWRGETSSTARPGHPVASPGARCGHLLQGDEAGQTSTSSYTQPASAQHRKRVARCRSHMPQTPGTAQGVRTRTHHTLPALVGPATSRLQCTSSTSSGASQRSGTHSWSAVTK